MPDASLLTDEVRALQGIRQPLGSVRVTARAVRRAAEVYTGTPPVRGYTDGENVPGYTIAALDSDGDEERPEIPRLLPNSLLISNDWQFERPLRLGEELQRTYSIANIAERFGGRFGYGIHVRAETEFVDESGGVVARTGSTMMQYDATEARDTDEGP